MFNTSGNAANPANPFGIDSLFGNPQQQMEAQLKDRQQKLFAATQVNAPGAPLSTGKISSMIGYGTPNGSILA